MKQTKEGQRLQTTYTVRIVEVDLLARHILETAENSMSNNESDHCVLR